MIHARSKVIDVTLMDSQDDERIARRQMDALNAMSWIMDRARLSGLR